MRAKLAEELFQPLPNQRQNDQGYGDIRCPKDQEEHVVSYSPEVLRPAIESAAVLDPTRNRPKLIRRRLIRARPDQAAIDHDLAYDALGIGGIGLRWLR